MKEFLAESWFSFKVLFKKEKYSPKVFCIGFNKTGTTTLGKSLELLGYDNCSFNKKVWRNLYKKGRIDDVIKFTAKFDSFDDLPWLLEDMIPLLDKKFPNSKFIYLTRPEEEWKNSYKSWSLKVFNKAVDADKGWNDYIDHQNFVLTYFESRKEDFISLSIKDPKGLKTLASFLKRTSPQDNFPHFNKT